MCHFLPVSVDFRQADSVLAVFILGTKGTGDDAAKQSTKTMPCLYEDVVGTVVTLWHHTRRIYSLSYCSPFANVLLVVSLLL